MSWFGQLDPTALERACGTDPGFLCREVLERTGDERLARLVDFVVAKPLTILLIILGAWVVNRIVRRAIRHAVEEIKDPAHRRRFGGLRRITPEVLAPTTEMSLRAEQRAETLGIVFRSGATVAIYTVALLLVLDELGINLAPLIAGAGIAGVALGFGAQSLVRDFLAGVFILLEDQYGVGDIVDLGEASGVVEVVNLRTTRLRDVEGTVWHVPNGEIRRVGNKSQDWARSMLDIQVAYGTDLDRAMTVIREVAEAVRSDEAFASDILEDPEVWGVEMLAADGINIRLVVKTRPGRQFAVSREIRRRIKERFDAEGIEIPFPQRTVWLRHDPADGHAEGP